MELMHNELEAFITTLRALNNKISSFLKDIDISGQLLSEDIGRVKEGISVHRTVNEVISGIISGMEDLASQSRAVVPASRRKRKAYAERTAGRPAELSRPAPAGDTKDGGGEDDDFGGNIEFF
jgi:hypothetical protein